MSEPLRPKPGIELALVWDDEEMLELAVVVCDGRSRFVSEVYTTPSELEKVAGMLAGLGPEAGAASRVIVLDENGKGTRRLFRMEVEFRLPGTVHLRTHQRDETPPGAGAGARLEAWMCVVSEPGLVDAFAKALRGLAAGSISSATLACG